MQGFCLIAAMQAARSFARAAPRTTHIPIQRSLFHSSAPALVKVGDSIPNVELVEGSPGNKVNISEELKGGRGIVLGVPAAFSTSARTALNLTHGEALRLNA